jgi:hypothetical protein
MKKLLFSCFCMALLVGVPANAQKLLDLYKKGTIRLIADKTFAQGNNWDKVFATYRDSMGRSNVGARKSLVILPDQSIIVNNTYRNFYTKFNAQGKFVKEFNLKSTKGRVFKKAQAIKGVLGNNLLFCAIDDPGNMYVIDFNGTWVKTLKFNFMDGQSIALPRQKMAVTGWTLNDSEYIHLVSLVDYPTNTQKIIWERRETRYDAYGTFGYPTFRNSGPIVASTNNQLIVVDPLKGELLMYNLDGKLLKRTPISWRGELISVQAQIAERRKALDQLKAYVIDKPMNGRSVEELKAAKERSIELMEKDLNNVTEPIVKPCVATIIKDSDGNLLFFDYPKEKNDNNFHVWVYAKGGEFVCESKFVCDDYDLIINPNRMVFHNGYLYSLQNLKGAKGIPMRLVRFKLTAP